LCAIRVFPALVSLPVRARAAQCNCRGLRLRIWESARKFGDQNRRGKDVAVARRGQAKSRSQFFKFLSFRTRFSGEESAFKNTLAALGMTPAGSDARRTASHLIPSQILVVQPFEPLAQLFAGDAIRDIGGNL